MLFLRSRRFTYRAGGLKLTTTLAGSRELGRAVDKAFDTVARRQGGLIRTIAKRSIRTARKSKAKNPRRKKGTTTSPPGKPPKNRTGALKHKIFWAQDGETVIIGPEKISKSIQGQPKWLHEGGTGIIRDFEGKKQRVKFEPRPFMRLALEKAQPKLAEMWTNTVKRG